MNKLSVLFVDDEEIMLAIGKQLLEHLGHKTMCVPGSLEALKIFQDDPEDFDMVITDYNMPDMNGAVLAKKLLVIRPDIPIVLSTGHKNIQPKHLKDWGFVAAVFKPYKLTDIKILINKIYRLLFY